MTECFEIVKVINGCKEKIYDVRDEYRVSGYAVRTILVSIDEKVCYLHYIVSEHVN
jgi:hypothetical protein